MPITVSCSCGKVFKVRDEAAGRSIRCQVCGAELTVQAGGEPPPGPSLATAPSTPIGAADVRAAPGDHTEGARRHAAAQQVAPAAAGKTTTCHFCAEDIPAGSMECPVCGESLKGHMSPEEQEALLQRSLEALDDNVSDSGMLEADVKLRGGFLAVRTMILALITAGTVAMIVGGFTSRDSDAEVLAGFGIMLFIPFCIAVLVSLAHDYGAAHIQDASTPEKAFRRFFMAVRTGRINKAYASLAPGARLVGPVDTVEFDKIPPNTGDYAINDAATFKQYWRSVFRGPSLQTRGVQLKAVRRVMETGDGLAVVEVECLFTNYPSLLVLLTGLLLVLLLQKKTKVRVHKLLMKRRGKWYIAEGEFEGPLDRVRPKRN